MFCRLIKPSWGYPTIGGNSNPEFIREIPGNHIYEGCFTAEYIEEKNKLGYNVYFFPNHPSTNIYSESKHYLNGRDIDVFNFIFVDMDLKDEVYNSKEEFYNELSNFSVAPTLTVDSGHGVHAYWRIENLERDLYIYMQLGLLNYFKTDDSVWTVLQLMRIPGSFNTKKEDEYIQSKIIQRLSTGKIYKFSDFPKEIFNIPQELQVKAQNHIARLDGKLKISFSKDTNIDEIPDSFISLFYENPQIFELFNNPQKFYGDRSAADMKLANILYSLDISKNDALAVIANSQKALSKGIHRYEYAALTIDKVYVDRTKNKFLTVGQKLKQGTSIIAGEPVRGPRFFDCLYNRWRKKQVLGLIGGSGIGKTSVTLKIFKDMIENNKENDDVFIFFSLEMPEQEIMERWVQLVGIDSPLADRLYVIGNEDDAGEPRNIGLQEIYEYATDIKKATGKNIASISIDHIGILSKAININKKYTFGIEQEQNAGYDEIRVLSLNTLCTQLKPLAKMLNTFLIILTQTTKEKGSGDIPIDKDGAYGISQYENIVDYIITIWQPLMRVQYLTEHYFLAWWYAKIRSKHKLDAIQTHQQKVLYYEMDTGNLRAPTVEEFESFKELLPAALEARDKIMHKRSMDYSPTNIIDLIEETTNKILGKQE